MEDLESQTLQVGPSTQADFSVGTYVSTKKNKQNLSRVYEKIHSNYEAFKKSNPENAKEVQNTIRGIVDLIENSSSSSDSAELIRISVFTSNMILCVDPAYRDDFIDSSKNIFQSLSNYFVNLSPSQQNNGSNNEQYQTLVFIYKLLMATRHPNEVASHKGSSTDSQPVQEGIINMREKLLNKDFMKKIFEIDANEFAPNSQLIAETWKMLLAFYSLFARKKDRIVAFGLTRSAKDCIFEAISQHKNDDASLSLHQALACLNFSLEIFKLTAKDLNKNNLIQILSDLLESPRILKNQLQVVLLILINFAKQNLLVSKPSLMTMCLGKAFKVFERAPSAASQLIAEIYKKDPASLKDITLQNSLALLKVNALKQNEAVFLQRISKQNTLLKVQLSNILLEVEGQMNMILPNSDVAMELCENGDIDVVLAPLLTCISVSSNSPFSNSETETINSSKGRYHKEEDPERMSDEDSQGTVSNFYQSDSQPNSPSIQSQYPIFAPADIQLYEQILNLIYKLISNTPKNNGATNNNAVPISCDSSSSKSSEISQPYISCNESQNMILSKLTSMHLSDILISLLSALSAGYNQLAQISSAQVPLQIRKFLPVAQLAKQILKVLASCDNSRKNKYEIFSRTEQKNSSSTFVGGTQQRV